MRSFISHCLSVSCIFSVSIVFYLYSRALTKFWTCLFVRKSNLGIGKEIIVIGMLLYSVLMPFRPLLMRHVKSTCERERHSIALLVAFVYVVKNCLSYLSAS